MERAVDQERGREEATAGALLRSAREGAGLTRGDVAARTKIAERHLLAIEEGRFSDLAGRTYAVGFARAYARAVGLKESEIAQRVRRELEAAQPVERDHDLPVFEPGDPARVPTRRLALIAALAVIVAVGALAYLWGGLFSPQAQLPDLLTNEPPAGTVAKFPRTPPPAAPVVNGPVVITALADNVWLQVTDADGNKLIERVLGRDEAWTVPADARGPRLRIGRPDAIAISVGERKLPPLADKPMTMSDISLLPRDLLAQAIAASGGSGKTPGSAAAAPGVENAGAPARRAAARPSRAPEPSVPATPSAPAGPAAETSSPLSTETH